MTAEDTHTEYGVNVSNKFAFLDGDDDVDPSVLIARAQKEKKKLKQKAAAAAAAPVKKVDPAIPAVVETTTAAAENGARPPRHNAGNHQRAAGNGPRGPRNFDRPPRQDRQPRNDRFPTKPAPKKDETWTEGDETPKQPLQQQQNAPIQQQGERPPRQPRFPRNENYNGGVRTFQRRDPNFVRHDGGGNNEGGNNNERPPRYDRHSRNDRTGVKSVSKKEGHGRGNWGNTQEQLQGETEPERAQDAEAAAKTDDAAAADESPAVDGDTENKEKSAVETPVIEPEAPKLTLSEWKAQNAASKTDFKTRQANEGGDDVSNKFVPIARDADQAADKKKDIDEKDGQKKKQKNIVNINVSFNDPNRRDFGDRREQRSGPRSGDFNGGGRGGGGFRGNDRGDRSEGGGGYNRGGPRHNTSGGGPSSSRGGGGYQHQGNAARRGPQLDSSDFPAL